MKRLFIAILLLSALLPIPAEAACIYYTGNEYVCLSGDTKPSVVADGARVYESDTRKHYLKVSGTWELVTDPALQVTGGNSHDHAGGDGAQIAYSGLSGLPTLAQNEAGASNNFLTAYNSTTGAFSKAQPAFSNISSTLALSQLTDDATSGLCLKSGGAGGDPSYGSCSAGGGYDTIQDETTPLTQRTTLNFTGTGVACADDTTRTTCTINTGGTDLSAEPFVTSTTSGNLSAERVLSNGTNTTIDTGTAGQIKVNLSGTHADSFHTDSYSGVGACGANTWASTLNDNAAPTCTQPAFSNLSGSISASQQNIAGASALGAIKGNGSTTACSGTDKMTGWDANGAMTCAADQTAGGGPTTAKLTSTYTNSTTTGTNVSGLNVTLDAGTWRFSYYLVSQTAAIATGIDYGVTFTGTQTLLVADMMYPDTGTTATGGNADGTVTGDGAELLMARGSTLTASTTAPNLNVITGVATANESFLARVEGVIVVTVSGTLQLWAASDVASSQVSILAGSNLLAFSH